MFRVFILFIDIMKLFLSRVLDLKCRIFINIGVSICIFCSFVTNKRKVCDLDII